MKNDFLENASLGKNEWWRYVLTILVMVLFAGLFTVIFGKLVMPIVKANFEKTPFTETLVTQISLGGTFAALLLGLWLMINKLHNRSFATLIYDKSKFSWKLWFFGFLAWSPMLILLSFLFQYQDFNRFLSFGFSLSQIFFLFFVGIICLGIQSTAEEIIFRGYALQGMSLKLKSSLLLALVNALVFASLHLGYGFQSLIESFVFGVVFTLIVLRIKRIEFAAGAHTVNNLILLLFFPPDQEKFTQFQWAIDWPGLVAFIISISLFYFLVLAFFNRKHSGMSKKTLFFIGIIVLLSKPVFSQSNSISNEWIKKNVHTINNDSLSVGKFNFLKEEISDKRIVFLGEATHYDGATFAVRSKMVEFLIKEMGFEVILFEAGMFDLMQANKEFQETGQSQKIKSSLWDFWRTQQWEHFYSSIEKHKQNGKPIQMAGFDCKFNSSYGFSNYNYSTFIEGIFEDKYSEATNTDEYKAYISIWKDIEKGYQQNGIKGGLAKIRYKMSDKDKIKFRQLSLWVVSKLNSIGEHKIAQMVKSNDESIIAYSDLRLLKLIFNKKSIIPINNRRDELMAENIIHLLKNVYPDKKIIVIGATYHFIRNNNLLEPIRIQGIPIQESVIMGNLIYNSFPNEIYTIGFTAYDGMYGVVDQSKKGTHVKSPNENSLEFQLASRGIENAFITLENSGNESFFSQGTVLRLFDHQSAASSIQWGKILDAVFFIKTMTPAYKLED
jgi:erythromycin esterase-like protein/membrane protease YdiL (CAAX protease family)